MSKTATAIAIPKLRGGLSLSKGEASVLLPVIRSGSITAGAISMLLDEPISKVTRALNSLEKKGLVMVASGIVPLYQASPPVLQLADLLQAFVAESESAVGEVASITSEFQKSTDKALAVLFKSIDKSSRSLDASYETYESDVRQVAQAQIGAMVDLTRGILSDFSQNIHDAMDQLNNSLENDIGEKLTLLQGDLDESQNQLEADMKRISKDFDKWMAQEKASTAKSVKSVNVSSKRIVAAASQILGALFQIYETSLLETTEKLSEVISSRALEATNNSSEVITGLIDTLKQKTNSLDALISQTLTSSQEKLSDTAAEARINSGGQAENLQRKLDEAVGVVKTFSASVDGWNEDVNGYMDTASESVLAQFEQLNASERAFLDMVRSSLAGFVERMNAAISDEYKGLRTITRGLTSDTDELMNEARTSVVALLQNEVSADRERLQTANDALQSHLATWNDKATKNIDKKVSSAVKEVVGVLDTESAELSSLTENLTSRLKSSFSGVVTTAETKNDAILTSIKRAADEYETNLETKLSEIAKEYTSAIQKEVSAAKTLYEGLNERLNTRLTDSTNALSSHASKAQKEIDATIEEQVSRIDRHAEEIRGEFHNRIEEITQQFITVTQSVESTFSGLVASQSVEARDLIASVHSEFKNSMKSEMDGLSEESIKLQQEFSSEIGMRIDSVVESTASLKRTLDEFSVEKESEVSKALEAAIKAIEVSLTTVQENLAVLESGTVKQFGENFQQISQEFATSVAGARDNISERLKSITPETSDILSKNTANVKTTVDTYLSEEMESMQRVLGETSRKLDKLATTNIKKTADKVNEFHVAMDTAQLTASTARNESRDKLMKAIEDRRAETAVAFDAASVWIESAMNNISSSLETLGSKLNNEAMHAQQALGKSVESAVDAFRDGSQLQVAQLEDIGSSYLKHIEGQLHSNISEFNVAGETTLNAGIDALAEFPEKVVAEAENASNSVLAEGRVRFESSQGEAEAKVAEFEKASRASAEEIENLINRIDEQATKSRDAAVEQIHQSAIVSNQYAARRLESVGVELKAAFSRSSYGIVEDLTSKVSESTSTMQESQKSGDAEISTASTQFQNSRAELLHSLSSITGESLKEWTDAARERSTALSVQFQEAMTRASDGAGKTSEMLRAIREASQELAVLPSENTWYMSGNEEICSYILDMAARSELSIVISIPNLACLDLKKLSKVKVPTRKVLIVPESEERDASLDQLKGWRIWELPSPALLSVMDDKEVLIGGLAENVGPFCVLSRDEAYLKLYQDIIGPAIIDKANK